MIDWRNERFGVSQKPSKQTNTDLCGGEIAAIFCFAVMSGFEGLRAIVNGGLSGLGRRVERLGRMVERAWQEG